MNRLRGPLLLARIENHSGRYPARLRVQEEEQLYCSCAAPADV